MITDEKYPKNLNEFAFRFTHIILVFGRRCKRFYKPPASHIFQNPKTIFTSAYRHHFLVIFISMCLSWINSNIVKAQTRDSVIYNKSQLVETINWTTYQPKELKLQPRTILRLNIALGTRSATETVIDDYQKYFSHLRLGSVWDASSDFIFDNDIGIRMAFYQFRTSHSDQNIENSITYIGPAFVIRLPFDQSPWEFDASVGIGYIEYRGKQRLAKFYGATIGAQFSMGFDYKISAQWGIGVNIQTTIGEITKFRHEKNGEKWTSTYESGEGEDLSQTGVGIGIRYYFK